MSEKEAACTSGAERKGKKKKLGKEKKLFRQSRKVDKTTRSTECRRESCSKGSICLFGRKESRKFDTWIQMKMSDSFSRMIPSTRSGVLVALCDAVRHPSEMRLEQGFRRSKWSIKARQNISTGMSG